MEDWLVESEELSVCVAFAELCALLINCKIHDWGQIVDNVEAVLQANLHVVLGSFLLHPLHVFDGIGIAEIQAVVVLLGRVSRAIMRECVWLVQRAMRDARFDLHLRIRLVMWLALFQLLWSDFGRVSNIPVLSGSIASQPLSAASLMRFDMMFRIT